MMVRSKIAVIKIKTYPQILGEEKIPLSGTEREYSMENEEIFQSLKGGSFKKV